MADTITLAMKMTFSKKDFEKAKALLNYHIIDMGTDIGATMPDDDFFIGDKIIDLNLSKLMATDDKVANELCLSMMLFMVSKLEKPNK